MLLPVNLFATNRVERAGAVLMMNAATMFIANQYRNGLGLDKIDTDWDGVGAITTLVVLARYPDLAASYSGIDEWISSSWIDYLGGTYDATSFGCKLLFYYYLVYQLGYTLRQVLRTPAC